MHRSVEGSTAYPAHSLSSFPRDIAAHLHTHKYPMHISGAAPNDVPRSSVVVNPTGSTKIRTTLAPCIRSLCDENPNDDVTFILLILESASALHRLYNECHLVNGDVSMRSLGWIPGRKEPMAVITDYDDHDPEDVKRLEIEIENDYQELKKRKAEMEK